MTTSSLDRIAEDLGYTGTEGFLRADEFAGLASHRYALRRAAETMGVEAAFGLFSGAGAKRRFTPLVYLASAPDEATLVELHRKIWSQGLVPYALVACGDEVVLCYGFAFDHRPDDRGTRVRLGRQTAWRGDDNARGVRAEVLRSSVAWSHFKQNGEGRVDRALLDRLDRLADLLTGGRPGMAALPPDLTQALIGRVLYVFLVSDRALLPDAWYADRSLPPPPAQTEAWSPTHFFALNDAVDEIFNGAVFPILPADRALVTADHLAALVSSIRYGGRVDVTGDQLGLFEVDLATLRVETLSAVYELFLEKLKPEEKRRSGAYYTPPFLVDFLLDEISEDFSWEAGTRVLDPSSGSGVFLVGAYRRLIERRLGTDAGGHHLTIAELRGILRESVFGVEKERAACQVSAFSLYLTMLDYVDPDEVRAQITTRDVPNAERLLPPMLGENIIVSDFFEAGNLPSSFVAFDVVVGNPPWGNVKKDGTPAMIAAFEARRKRLGAPRRDRRGPPPSGALQLASALSNEAAPLSGEDSPSASLFDLGRAQSAEMFVLEVIENRLRPGGRAAFVLPSGSYINHYSTGFRQRLAQLRVVSVVNLAAFRRTLFVHAEQAAATVVLRNAPAEPGTLTRFDSPSALSQPVRRRDNLWTLLRDEAETEYVESSDLADDRNWIRAINGRGIDRRILDYIDRSVRHGKLITFAAFAPTLTIKTGDRYKYTGIPDAYRLSTQAGPRNYLTQIRRPGLGFAEGTAAVPMPDEILRLAKSDFGVYFLGPTLLIPRRIDETILAQRAGFNDTLFGATLADPALRGSSEGLYLLKGLELYLNSRIARYLLTLNAPTAMIDRPRLRLADIRTLPLPYRNIGDPNLARALRAAPERLDEIFYRIFSIDGVFRKAIDEFIDYREKFKNANVPTEAWARAPTLRTDQYADLLAHHLMGRTVAGGGASVKLTPDYPRSLIALQMTLQGDDGTDDVPAALAQYTVRNHSPFTDSLFIYKVPTRRRFILVKPAERHHWTLARAYADAEIVLNSIFTSSGEGASA